MIRIAIIVGSTRPGRRADAVAQWVHEVSLRHPAVSSGETTVEVVDLADYGLPLLDEAVPALFGEYRNAHTRRWATEIASFDGFVFVTPEYNHSYPAALKNAIDFLYAEWHNKAAGFVSYGLQGGTRAVEHLRGVLSEMKVADISTQVALSTFTDFEFADPTDPLERGECTPSEYQMHTLMTMLDELIAWSRALKSLRESTHQVPVGTVSA